MGIDSAHERDEKRLHSYGRKNWREETSCTLEGIRNRVILDWILKKWYAGVLNWSHLNQGTD
jgi:hypothetical protein